MFVSQGRKSAYVEIQGVGKGGVREKWIRVGTPIFFAFGGHLLADLPALFF